MAKQVIVFHMTGCEPCREYLPRFKRAAELYKGKLDVRSVNLAKSDRSYQDAAIKFKVNATPTTIVIDESDKVLRKRIGGLEDKDIAALLKFAAS